MYSNVYHLESKKIQLIGSVKRIPCDLGFPKCCTDKKKFGWSNLKNDFN